jgi:hypothetical protein
VHGPGKTARGSSGNLCSKKRRILRGGLKYLLVQFLPCNISRAPYYKKILNLAFI